MKAVRNTSQALEFKHLHTTQGIAHIKLFFNEGQSETCTGKLVWILAENHDLEVGMVGGIIQQNYDGWVTSH